jgi:serine protease
MVRSFRAAIFRAVVASAALSAAWPLLSQHVPLRAQEAADLATPPAAPPQRYRLRLTLDRAAAFATAAGHRLNYVPGEVLVRFRDGVTPDGQQRALLGLRSRPSVSALRWIGSIALLQDSAELDAHALAAALRAQPEVAWAEPNYIRRRRLEPNDPGYASFQWNLRAIDMPRVWDINPGGGSELIVAVIDTGVTTATEVARLRTWNGSAIQEIDVPYMISPDFTASRLVSPNDIVFWDGPVVDFEGHGTHVAGTIGQDANNDLGETGIAYNVKIMPVKACLSFWDIQFAFAEGGVPGAPPPDVGGCPDDAVAQGLRYAADNGAKVINVSIGGFAPSETMRDALLYATSKGAVVTIAAGNSFEDGNPVEFPASYAQDIGGAVSVGAVGRTRARAYYSGTASGTELAAPGGDFREGGPDGMIWQTSLLPPDSTPGEVVFPRFDRYADVAQQGTSMAAPHVAGVAALLISQGVTNPAAVEALLKATAVDLGAAGRDDEFGHGYIQPRLAIRGFGIFTR